MKELVRQFYNEGFATTFYQKPIKYLKKKLKNKSFYNFLSLLIKTIYTIIVIAFALFVFYKKLPI